jgi:hypothetical protein
MGQASNPRLYHLLPIHLHSRRQPDRRQTQTAALERIRSMFAHSEPLAIQTVTRQVPGCIRNQAPLLTRPWLATLMASGSPGFQGNRAGLYQRWTDTQSHHWQYHHGSATRYYWMIDGPMRYLGMSGYLSTYCLAILFWLSTGLDSHLPLDWLERTVTASSSFSARCSSPLPTP